MGLKYEGKFKVGDVIKSFDWKPIPERGESYVVGEIIAVHYAGAPDIHFHCYEIVVSESVFGGVADKGRVGEHIFVPMELSVLDFHGRVALAA